MFDGLTPEVDALLNAAKSDLPTAQANPDLIDAMTLALSVDALAPAAAVRKRAARRTGLAAKAAAITGVLLLSGGVASAATGTLPDPAQNAASDAAEHVGLHIPKSDKKAKHDVDDDKGKDATAEHPDNHGKDVSTVAHDPANKGEDHGTAVCTVASDGKCKPNADDNSGKNNSADHRQNEDHGKKQPTTTTTAVSDDNGGESGGHGGGSDNGKHGSND